jgi:hypothetical protein
VYDHGFGCWVYRIFICGGGLTTTYRRRIRVWRFSRWVWFYRRCSDLNDSINKYFFDNFYGAVNKYFFDYFNRFFY